MAQPNTDGVYIFRGLLGLETVVPLIFRQIDPTILPDADIVDNIEVEAGMAFDVDSDGVVLPNTDGTYLFRSLQNLETVVPEIFRLIDPTIPSDAVIDAAVKALCPTPPTE